MNTILVWLLINLASGSMRLPVQFPTQAACMQAASRLRNVEPYPHPYQCVQMRVVADTGTIVGPSPSESVDKATQQRAARNYDYEQQKIQALLSQPPHPVE